MTIRRSVLALALVASIAGCGGGGGGGGGGPAAPDLSPIGVTETESNDFNAQAVGTLSARDIIVSGSTASLGDVDLYRVTASATVNLFVSLDWNSASDLELTISNAGGIFVRQVDTAGHPESCRLPALPAGNYTVRVGSLTNAATSYSLTLALR